MNMDLVAQCKQAERSSYCLQIRREMNMFTGQQVADDNDVRPFVNIDPKS